MKNLDLDDVLRDDLKKRHRDAMLDLILAWGELDGALGMLVSCVLGKPMVEGAEMFGKLPASKKFQEIYKMLRDAPNGKNAARVVKKHKKNYEKYSVSRNCIAHSKCIGVRKSDTDFIIFAKFEKRGENELAVDLVPIQEMHRAEVWGREMTKLAMRIVDEIAPI